MRTVTTKIGDREITLRIDFATAAQFEKATGQTVFDPSGAVLHSGLNAPRLLYLAAKDHTEGINKREDVDAILESEAEKHGMVDVFRDVMNAIGEAMTVSTGAGKEKKGKAAEKDEDGGGSGKS